MSLCTAATSITTASNCRGIGAKIRRQSIRHRFRRRQRQAGTTSLDDNQTQSVIRFLVRLDNSLGFKQMPVHRAARDALEGLLPAQFSNGEFPLVWKAPVKAQPPLLQARYPEHDRRNERQTRTSVDELPYDGAKLPSHYGWKLESRIDSLKRQYHDLIAQRKPPPRSIGDLQSRVGKILNSLDQQGRWISTYRGEPLVGQPNFAQHSQSISSAVFSRNLSMLCDYLRCLKAG